MKEEFEHQQTHPAFKEQPFSDRVLSLVNSEAERRRNNRINRLIKNAKFKYLAAPEEIKFSAARGLPKSDGLELLKCAWVDRGQHILITGPCAKWKSDDQPVRRFIAISIGRSFLFELSAQPSLKGMRNWDGFCNQTLENRILLENYFLPGELEAQIAAFVGHYNHPRYHESLNNVTPADAYTGRGHTILLERAKTKQRTMKLRRLQHAKSAA